MNDLTFLATFVSNKAIEDEGITVDFWIREGLRKKAIQSYMYETDITLDLDQEQHFQVLI